MQNGSTGLIAAAYNGHQSIAELLLDRKAQIDLQNNVMMGEGEGVGMWGEELSVVGRRLAIRDRVQDSTSDFGSPNVFVNAWIFVSWFFVQWAY